MSNKKLTPKARRNAIYLALLAVAFYVAFIATMSARG